jgi:hypothetical protein
LEKILFLLYINDLTENVHGQSWSYSQITQLWKLPEKINLTPT